MSYRWFAASVLAAGAAVVGLAACGSSSSTTPPSSATTAAGSSAAHPTATGIKTANTSLGTVLVDAQGYVLYWFASDTSTASNCNGSCASYWPPVIGKPTLAAGVSLPGTLGTITRQNGQLQATYDGHPLYTYMADKPDSPTGNDLTDSFGLWYAMTPSGAKATASSGSGSSSGSSGSGSSGSGGSGGYGY